MGETILTIAALIIGYFIIVRSMKKTYDDKITKETLSKL